MNLLQFYYTNRGIYCSIPPILASAIRTITGRDFHPLNNHQFHPETPYGHRKQPPSLKMAIFWEKIKLLGSKTDFFIYLGRRTLSQMGRAWVLKSKSDFESPKHKPCQLEDGILTKNAYFQHVLGLRWPKNFFFSSISPWNSLRAQKTTSQPKNGYFLRKNQAFGLKNGFFHISRSSHIEPNG